MIFSILDISTNIVHNLYYLYYNNMVDKHLLFYFKTNRAHGEFKLLELLRLIRFKK